MVRRPGLLRQRRPTPACGARGPRDQGPDRRTRRLPGRLRGNRRSLHGRRAGSVRPGRIGDSGGHRPAAGTRGEDALPPGRHRQSAGPGHPVRAPAARPLRFGPPGPLLPLGAGPRPPRAQGNPAAALRLRGRHLRLRGPRTGRLEGSRQRGGQGRPSSLSDFGRGMRWVSGRMDARRDARAMVIPWPSGATPQTPPRHPTRRAVAAFCAWRCCGSLVWNDQTALRRALPCAKIGHGAPTSKVRQAARLPPRPSAGRRAGSGLRRSAWPSGTPGWKAAGWSASGPDRPACPGRWCRRCR